MAAEKKAKHGKRKEELELSGDEEMDTESIGSEKEIMGEFEGFPPTDGDVGGIAALLQQSLAGPSVDFTGLADLIIDQTPLGCVVKTAAEEGEDDVFAVFSVLDLAMKKEAMKKVRKYLLKKAEKKPQLHSVLSKPSVGWLISERFANLPFHVTVPALESLLKDMRSGGDKFKFDHFAMLIKILVPKGGKGKGDTEERMFVQPEEELLSEDCEIETEWELNADESFRVVRQLVVFPSATLDTYIAKIKKELPSQ